MGSQTGYQEINMDIGRIRAVQRAEHSQEGQLYQCSIFSIALSLGICGTKEVSKAKWDGMIEQYMNSIPELPDLRQCNFIIQKWILVPILSKEEHTKLLN
jgi:hypothetical protein